MRTYENIWKITTREGDDCTTGCLIGYPYCEKYYKMISIDLSKQETLDADPKARYNAIYNKNIERNGNTTQCFSLLKKRRKTI